MKICVPPENCFGNEEEKVAGFYSETCLCLNKRSHFKRLNSSRLMKVSVGRNCLPQVNVMLNCTLILIQVLCYVKSSSAFCPNACQCDDVSLYITCANSGLDVVPILMNPRTISLNLSCNRIKTIISSFAFYHELKILNISHNEINSLGEGNFVAQIALGELNIRNNSLTEVPQNAFEGLSSLHTLDLSYNNLQTIHYYAFAHVPKLMLLNISGNDLEVLPDDILLRQKNLKSLDLSHNRIVNIRSALFQSLSSLRNLFLISNKLTEISGNSFGYLISLSYLILDKNLIENITLDAFAGTKKLSILSLKNNHLSTFPTEQVGVASNLTELYLDNNHFKSIPSNAMVSLHFLKKLSISSCTNLKKVDKLAFQGLVMLEELEISHNPMLSELETGVLSPIQSIKKISLANNTFRKVPSDVLSLSYVQHLDLRGNDFDCSCDMRWLKEALLNKTFETGMSEVLCSHPQDLKGRRLSQLSNYELKCFFNIIVFATCGTAITIISLLLCIVFAIYCRKWKKMQKNIHDDWPEKILSTWRESEINKSSEANGFGPKNFRSTDETKVSSIWQDSNCDRQLSADSLMYVSSTKSSEVSNHLNISHGGYVIPRTNDQDLLNTVNLRGSDLTHCKILGSNDAPGNVIRNGFAQNLSLLQSEISCNIYETPQRNHKLVHPRTLRVEKRDITKLVEDKYNTNLRKISRDPGYYSCEFLNKNNDSSSFNNQKRTTSINHYSRPQNCYSSFKSPIPGSDSGVFTLTSVYSRQSATISPESIYDNII